MIRTGAIPAELRQRPQWVLWRLEERDGKLTKVPYRAADPTRTASTTEPGTWATFEAALQAGRSAIKDRGVLRLRRSRLSPLVRSASPRARRP